MKAALTSVSWRCAICGVEFPTLRDPMVPPGIPFGRIRICQSCKRVVCARHSDRVGKDAYLCTECGTAAKP